MDAYARARVPLDGFAVLCRVYRERLKMSQAELAQRLGIAQSTLSRIERAERCVAFAELLAFADIVDEPADRIFSEVLSAGEAIQKELAELGDPRLRRAARTLVEVRLLL